MKELETLRVSPGHRASLNLSEGERESVKWGVLDNPPPRPTYHLSSSPWKVRQSHRGILQPVSLRSGLTSLPQSVIVWELGASGAFCSDPKDPSYNTHTHTHTHTHNPLGFLGSSIKPQMVKILPAMQKTWLRSLGGEDPLEMGMATHSSIVAWSIPWREKPGG